MVNSRSSLPRSAASGVENDRCNKGSNSTLPSPPALPYGTMLHTPLDKVKSKIRESDRASPNGGAQSPAQQQYSQFHRGWLWKDENKRQLTRVFLTFDKSSRNLTFSNIDLPLEQMTPTHIKGSVDLVPGNAVVSSQTASAFGATVHMLEINNSMTGEIYRFTGNKEELKPWASALRSSLRVTE